MLAAILAWSVRHRAAVFIAAALFVAWGVQAAVTLPIDAVPDLTNTQVQVLTSAPSLGAVDVERLVSAPVERVMTGLPRLKELRSLSRAGVSAVTVVFEDGMDAQLARQLVSERMPQVREAVSPRYGVPDLGPMTTGLGEIYQFEVRGDGHSMMDLRARLDWEIAPRIRLVPGVVEVNTFGGELRTLEVTLDPVRLVGLGLSLGDVVAAMERDNRVAGGGVILRGAEGILVRGEALVGSLADLRRIVVRADPRAPVLLGHLGVVREAPMPRWGAATRDGRGEVVVGMAMMRVGENSRVVSRAVDAVVRDINRSLPGGIRVEPFYDRTTMVDRTLRTVAKNLAEGGALVVIVLFLLLRNLRAGVVVALVIPLSMFGAVIGLRALGITGNLMSLGAIDFGLVVDGAIILIENAVHHLSAARESRGRALTPEERDAVVLDSAQEVRSATAFGELIVAIVYAPILALQGVEGKLFHPMAFAVLFALGAAFVLSITLVPALAAALLARDTHDRPSPVVVYGAKLYAPALRVCLAWPKTVVTLVLVLLGATAALGSRLGTEFVPVLDEGSFAIEVIRLPSTALNESVRQTAIIERALRRFPEVVTVVSKSGRPEIANDPMGPDQSDLIVMLRPRHQWSTARDREALVARMSEALTREVPGVGFGFSQPIQMRTNELVSGVRADFAVMIYGEDLRTLSRVGAALSRRLGRVQGAADVRADRVEGLPVVRVSIDRDAAARRGLSAEELLRVIDATGGITVGEVLDGTRRFPLRLRLGADARASVDALRRIPIRTASGALIPIADVARVELDQEPGVVGREATQRRLVVQCNVRGRDLGGFADEAQAVLRRDVTVPAGYHLGWGGQFENLRSAKLRLGIVVPLALAAIFGLLLMTFGELRPALLVFGNVPFACVGGVLALSLRGLPFSISAAVGFIALFGVAVLNGLVLVSQIRGMEASGSDTATAVWEGSQRRLRPVLTTALVASLGFIPMALATSEGAEVQRPLATVVIGGLISATLLTLLVLPTIYRWSRGTAREANPEAAS